MSEIKEGDLVFIQPPAPVVGKVIRVWTFQRQYEIEWPSGNKTIYTGNKLKKVADHPGEEYTIKRGHLYIGHTAIACRACMASVCKVL